MRNSGIGNSRNNVPVGTYGRQRLCRPPDTLLTTLDGERPLATSDVSQYGLWNCRGSVTGGRGRSGAESAAWIHEATGGLGDFHGSFPSGPSEVALGALDY